MDAFLLIFGIALVVLGGIVIFKDIQKKKRKPPKIDL